MQRMYSHLQGMVGHSTALLAGKCGKPTEGVIFPGNPTLAFPSLLFDDPVLEPVDRNVWVALKMAVMEGGGGITAMPNYGELMRRCNIGSKATIARSLSILRSTRWLTVCKATPYDGGRVRGNIYALHDQPLQLAGTLGLDGNYRAWLEGTAEGKHTPHPRAVAVAVAVLRDIQQAQLQGDKGIPAVEPAVAKPAMATGAAATILAAAPEEVGLAGNGVRVTAGTTYQKAGISYNVPGICLVRQGGTPSTETVLNGLPADTADTADNAGKQAETDGDRQDGYRNCTDGGLGTVPVLGGKGGSSKYLEREEENTTTYPVVTTEIGGDAGTVLTWPAGLHQADATQIRQQLASIPSQHRQPVLDSLAAKLSSVANGKSQPFLWSANTYTRRLCELAVAGKLNPVPTIAPVPPDNPDTLPQTPEAVDRALKALACELSNVGAEAKRMRQLAAADSHLAGAALEAEKQWQAISQRYTELKQMQGRMRH